MAGTRKRTVDCRRRSPCLVVYFLFKIFFTLFDASNLETVGMLLPNNGVKYSMNLGVMSLPALFIMLADITLVLAATSVIFDNLYSTA